MKMRKRGSLLRALGVFSLGAGVLVSLSSCDGEEGTTLPEAQQVKETTSVPREEPTAKKDILFEMMVYEIGRKISGMASVPELTEDVRNMLLALQSYYDEMAPLNVGTPERARLALRIADVLRDLTAWDKALAAFDTAQNDYDALSDHFKAQPEIRRIQSAIYDGQGVCMLRRGRPSDAQAAYEKAQVVYAELYAAVAPKDDEKLPDGDLDPALSLAAEDLMFSYRCLGDCQIATDDPEEARETYQKGIKLAQRLDRLSPGMTLQYIRLLGSQGNLESSCGRKREALTYWVQAAQICQRLYNSTSSARIRAQVAQLFQNLRPQILELAQQLQSAEAAKSVDEQNLPVDPAPVPSPEI